MAMTVPGQHRHIRSGSGAGEPQSPLSQRRRRDVELCPRGEARFHAGYRQLYRYWCQVE
jgi:hypothetical protein